MFTRKLENAHRL